MTTRELILTATAACMLGCGGGDQVGDAVVDVPDGWDGDTAGEPDAWDTAGDTADVPDSDAADTWIDTDVPASCTVTTDLGFSLVLPDITYGNKFVDEAGDLLVTVPDYIAPSLDRLLAVSLTPGSEAAVSLAVSGDAPPLQVAAVAHDPAAARTVILGYAMTRPGDGGIGDHMELLALDVDGATATLARLEPTSAPPSEGYMFSWIYPEGDGTHYRAFRYAEASVRAAVSGTSVAWEPEIAVSTDGAFDQNYVAHDPTGGRLFAYGEFTVEGVPPGPYTQWLEPVVFELAIAGGTSWIRVPAAGAGPPRLDLPFLFLPGSVFWDDGGDRLVLFLDHPYTDPWIGEMTVAGAWSMSGAGSWTTVAESLGFCCSPYPGADDRERRRSLSVTLGGLAGTDLRPGYEGESIAVSLDTPLYASPVSAAFDGSRGRILAVAEAGLVSMAVRDGYYLWMDADGSATWPAGSSTGSTIVVDASRDRVVLFGGSSTITGEETNETSTLDLASGTPAWAAATVTGDVPAARTWHSAIVDEVSGTMYVAGGYSLEGTTVTDLADVAALDLSTMAWRHVATLPSGRSMPILDLADGGATLRVMFGDAHPNPADPYTLDYPRDAYSVDIATGEVTALVVSGDLPTGTVRGMAALDLASGPVVVSAEPYGVEVFVATFAAGTMTLVSEAACEDPRTPLYGYGVVDPVTGTGWIVGRAVWRVDG